MRAGKEDAEIKQIIVNQLNNRAKDGWEAEQLRAKNVGIHESMATIGG